MATTSNWREQKTSRRDFVVALDDRAYLAAEDGSPIVNPQESPRPVFKYWKRSPTNDHLWVPREDDEDTPVAQVPGFAAIRQTEEGYEVQSISGRWYPGTEGGRPLATQRPGAPPRFEGWTWDSKTKEYVWSDFGSE